jgi:hypothetical protein
MMKLGVLAHLAVQAFLYFKPPRTPRTPEALTSFYRRFDGPRLGHGISPISTVARAKKDKEYSLTIFIIRK